MISILKRLFCLASLGVWLKSLFLLFFFCFTFRLVGQTYYKYDDQLQSIYNTVTELKLNKAKSDLKAYQKENPSNLSTYHISSYIDFFTLFINEDPVLFEQLYLRRSQYIDKIKTGPTDTPEKKFIHAEILLQWALIDLKFDNKFKAGRSIYEAYNLLEKNKELYPKYINNNKSLSIIHVLAESVPPWVRTLLGITGSLSTGQNEIDTLKDYALNHPKYMFRSEVAAINSYILFYQSNKKTQAIADLKNFDLDHKSSPIIAFLKASMSLRSGDNESCITYLTESPKGSAYSNFYYLDFMLGRSKLYKLDEEADQPILRYVNNFKGKHFIKEAYQKLAWHALVVKKDKKLYSAYMNLCRSKGENLLDEDKQALKEAQANTTPNEILLEARILFDGGYFHQCYQTLTLHLGRFNSNKIGQIELNYRLGRVLQALNNPQEALQYFSKALDLGEDEDAYFACSAALNIATIYENQSSYSSAILYYKTCLRMNPSEYATTLHQKAKSGLERIE